jgi:hypothetical protein
MIIDVFNHHISKSVEKIIAKAKYYGEGKEFPYPPENADPEARLGIMEKYGVDMQALTQTTPILLGLSDYLHLPSSGYEGHHGGTGPFHQRTGLPRSDDRLKSKWQRVGFTGVLSLL